MMKASTFLSFCALQLMAGLPFAVAKETKAPTPGPPATKLPLTRADIDAAIQAFQKSHPGLTSKAEVDQSLERLRSEILQRLDADNAEISQQKLVLAQIQNQTQSDAVKLEALRAQVEDKPFWQSGLFGVLMSGLLSALVAWSVARWNNSQSRDQAQKALSREIISNWQEQRGDIGKAFGVLENPNELANPVQRDKVIAVGDFYDHIARQWNSGAADRAELEKAKFPDLFNKFKTALENAERQGGDVKTLADNWSNLWEISGRPNF